MIKQVEEWIEEAIPKSRFEGRELLSKIPASDLAVQIAATLATMSKVMPLQNVTTAVGKVIAAQSSPSSELDVTIIANLGWSIISRMFYHEKCNVRIEFSEEKIFNGLKKPQIDVWFDEEWLFKVSMELSVAYKEANISKSPPKIRNRFLVDGRPLSTRVSKKAKKEFGKSKVPMLYDHINKLQQVPFLVNVDVYNVIMQCLDKPLFTFENKKNLDRETRVGLMRDQSVTLHIAENHKDAPFWFYWGFDWRGRYYNTSSYLSTQGNKLAKSLIKLQETKPLGSDGWFWLLVHAANCAGQDKLTIDERFEWSQDHLESIQDVFDDPVKHYYLWSEMDDPYGFLAACLEIGKALASGDYKTFKSGLMIGMDATCSGMQIFSMLSRDEETAKLCNLTLSDEIGDSYLYIADKIWEEKLDGDDYWMKYKDKRRKIVKRSVMTFFYSCGAASMGEHIWNDFKTDIHDLSQEECNKLGQLIHEACKTHLPGPAQVRKLFVHAAAKKSVDNKQIALKGIENGFPFEQVYWHYKTKQVGHKVMDKNGKRHLFQPSYAIENSKFVDKRKASTGSAPNIIHHLDSQIVARILNLATDYTMIPTHDCFYCIPADVGKMYEDCRIAFYQLFKDDLLQEICDQLGVKNTIKMGKLDPKWVLDNQYCFG